MDAWTRDFTTTHPDTPARVTLRAKFSAEAFDALLRGDVQVAPFSRELFPSERARYFEKFGVPPTLVPIATGSRATKGGTHAIAIFVNERNPIARLTLPQLRDLFSADGEITRWGQLGLTGEWAAKKVSAHGMLVRRETGNPPGIVNYLDNRLLNGRAWRTDLVAHADVAGGPQALELIVRAVAADETAIGYSGFAYAQPGTKALALATIDGGEPFSGTADDVARRDYPLARTLYLCVAPKPDTATHEFVRFAQSEAGQRAVAADAEKFFPLPPPISSVPAGGYITPSDATAVVGYNDMQEMLGALATEFSFRHPDIRFALDLKGTRTGPPALAAGRSLFAPMGAEFSAQELATYRAATGDAPQVFRVAHASLDPHALSGPLAIFVHRTNPLASVILDEVAAIFSGAASARDLHPCGLAPETALGLFFRDRVLGRRALAADFAGFAQSAEVVKRVGADPHAIGFAAAMRVSPDVKILALAPHPGDAPVPLTKETLVAGRYPLDRHLLICTRRAVEPLTREFLRFALSREGQSLIAQGTLGYLPLNESEIAAELAKLGSR